MNEPMDILRPMSVAALTRLLNSTPLGMVVAGHHVYRHRIVAGGRCDRDGRIDLVRYTAWLFSVRSEGGALPGRRQGFRRTIGHDGSVNKGNVRDLVDRQSYRCALTGRRLTAKTAVLDHIVPVSRGGDHRIGNAQVLDRAVNRAKSILTNEEFIALCTEVYRHARSQSRRGPSRRQRADCAAEAHPSLFPTEN